MKKFQFTQDGYNKLQQELENLKKTKHPKAVTRLQTARSMGDLKENSEYSAAKEDLAFIENRVQELEEVLKNAEIIAPTASNAITIGCKVTVDKDGTTIEYFIVGEFEADPMKNKLSSTSPIGKALLGKKAGDTVQIEVPAGKITYKILDITNS